MTSQAPVPASPSVPALRNDAKQSHGPATLFSEKIASGHFLGEKVKIREIPMSKIVKRSESPEKVAAGPRRSDEQKVTVICL